jgi:uncharacterized protein (TIGR00251 family)
MSTSPADRLPDLKREFASKGAIVLSVKVIPRAQQSAVVGFLEDGSLKLKVAAAPEQDEANREVCSIVAELFSVPNRNVSIVAGRTTTRKRVSVKAGG